MAIFVGGVCLLAFASIRPMSYRGDGGHSRPPIAGISGLGGNGPRINLIDVASQEYARDVATERRALMETADAGTRLLDMVLAIIGSVTVFCGELEF